MQAVPSVTNTGFRAHARRALYLRARIARPTGAWETEATILNLGLGGACVALARKPALDEEIVVTIFLFDPQNAETEALSLRGRVAWTREASHSEPARAGVAFEHEARALARLDEALGKL